MHQAKLELCTVCAEHVPTATYLMSFIQSEVPRHAECGGELDLQVQLRVITLFRSPRSIIEDWLEGRTAAHHQSSVMNMRI